MLLLEVAEQQVTAVIALDADLAAEALDDRHHRRVVARELLPAVGARAGLALTPGIAAYGKVGYTALDTKAFTSAGSLDELEENAGGIRFGGGLQVQLPGPLEARVEYRRSRYEDVVDSQFGDLTTDQVVAGIGLRF